MTHCKRAVSSYSSRNAQLSKTRNSSWILSENNFYTAGEVKAILRYAERQRQIALKRKLKTKIKEWMLINLAFGTGMRVSEMAKLECRDLFLTENFPFIYVRESKCGKSRGVKISKSLKDKIGWFLNWKKKANEITTENAPLLESSNSKSHFSTRGLQVIFKRVLKQVGINKQNNIHMARHSYATALLNTDGNNLVFVKEQLGHSSISVTEIYLHVIEKHAQKALEQLYR